MDWFIIVKKTKHVECLFGPACPLKNRHKLGIIFTFTDAANEMCGNIFVVYPPSGQVENYIPGRPLTVGEKIRSLNSYFLI